MEKTTMGNFKMEMRQMENGKIIPPNSFTYFSAEIFMGREESHLIPLPSNPESDLPTSLIGIDFA